jgi:hypothetical protein
LYRTRARLKAHWLIAQVNIGCRQFQSIAVLLQIVSGAGKAGALPSCLMLPSNRSADMLFSHIGALPQSGSMKLLSVPLSQHQAFTSRPRAGERNGMKCGGLGKRARTCLQRFMLACLLHAVRTMTAFIVDGTQQFIPAALSLSTP